MSESNKENPSVSLPRHVVIAEDDEDDFFLLQTNFHTHYPHVRITLVRDGEELMECLRKAESAPNLIILDLNMPKKDGREALVDIRRDPLTQKTPVVVFTTSNSDVDRHFVLTQGAMFYTKPFEMRSYETFMHSLREYIG